MIFLYLAMPSCCCWMRLVRSGMRLMACPRSSAETDGVESTGMSSGVGPHGIRRRASGSWTLLALRMARTSANLAAEGSGGVLMTIGDSFAPSVSAGAGEELAGGSRRRVHFRQDSLS